MTSDKAVEMKGGMYAFMSLRLHSTDLDAIERALVDKVQQAPGFFKDTPVVVDLSALETPPAREIEEDGDATAPHDGVPTTLDGEALIRCIRRAGLVPIVASTGDKSSPLAASVSLPLIESGARRSVESDARPGDGAAVSLVSGAPGALRARPDGSSDGSLPGTTGQTTIERVEYVVRTPMLVDRPVRSGQQLYARDTDLVVVGQVGPGAEVIADNNIHVYGPLRGRALCGVSGNTDARIFCQSLEAELVSVAGNFRMLETIPENLRGRPAKIFLDNERLSIEPL